MATGNKDIESVIEKIKGCFALANDGADCEESDTAMLLAQRLMARYSLSMNDIELEDEKREKNVVEKDGTEYGKVQWWMKSLGVIIAENFRCYIFSRSFNRKSKIVFLGLEDDVRICKAVFEFAVTSIKFHSDHYIKQRGVSGDRSTTIAIKNDFVAGYLQGLKDKFKEQIERENLSVILIKDSLVVREYESYNMKKGGKISARSSGDSEAKEKGYKEGRKFRH